MGKIMRNGVQYGVDTADVLSTVAECDASASGGKGTTQVASAKALSELNSNVNELNSNVNELNNNLKWELKTPIDILTKTLPYTLESNGMLLNTISSNVNTQHYGYQYVRQILICYF